MHLLLVRNIVFKKSVLKQKAKQWGHYIPRLKDMLPWNHMPSSVFNVALIPYFGLCYYPRSAIYSFFWTYF